MAFLGDKLNEGKTKQIFASTNNPHEVVVVSKDRITAGNAARAHDVEGKAKVSNETTCKVFEMLQTLGLKTHFVAKRDERSFIARRCEMVPIEWVTRRIATGSFLKRNPGVKEGYKFCPPKQETFFKDDANNDPQYSDEQIVASGFVVAGKTIGQDEVDIMSKLTLVVFEVLERAWATVDCTLVDMKIEFGVDTETGEILLADVIDSDSWRLWPSGDPRLMKDKQVYRNLAEVTKADLQLVIRNFQWVSDNLDKLIPPTVGKAVIFMGSASDEAHCRKIAQHLDKLGVPYDLRVSSAHKGTSETLRILARYEGQGIPIVVIAVAGRSNGLGPVLSGNTAFPVINCPPIDVHSAPLDVWSSLNVPSGLGCATVMYPEGAALAAASILALNDHVIWGRLRVRQANTAVSLKLADQKMLQKL